MPHYYQTAKQFNYKLQLSKIIADLQTQGSTKRTLPANTANSDYIEANNDYCSGATRSYCFGKSKLPKIRFNHQNKGE